MAVYTIDLKVKLMDETVIDGQYNLYVGHPKSDRWGICSSDEKLQGLKGTFNFSEKLGFEGTTFFKEETEQQGESAIITLKLRAFRGGIIDAASWRVGKGGTGFWVSKPRPDIKNEFEWTITKVDNS